jgi:hypothetical protein
MAARPTDADTPMIASLSKELNRQLPAAVFIVKVRLEKPLEPTGDGWALYVGSTRIPKYWEYRVGIYFKVFDQAFLADHQGEPLRFSHNDQEFVDTGVNLPAPGPARAATTAGAKALPLQSHVLKERLRARPTRAAVTRTRSARAIVTRRLIRQRKTRKPR